MSAASASLEGAGVLVTRPAHQSAGLAQRIADAGGKPLLFPAVEIEPLPGRLSHEQLARFDLAIFASANAVRFAADAIRAAGGLPPGLRVAAIGPATAAELEARGLLVTPAREVLVPSGRQDSEALLELLPRERVAGQRIAIVRGEGGRPVLADALRSRGAEVEYVECYRRRMPAGDLADLLRDGSSLGAVTATSAQIVENLFRMAGGNAARLRATPMFVIHPRIAAAACRLGVGTVVVTGGGDAALVEGLATWFGRARPARP
jgi:uroporphyrinogen-III synthase